MPACWTAGTCPTYLTAFSREGYVAPGNYILDIWLNDQPVREQYPVRVVPVAGRDAAVICVTTDMVAMLGLKDKIIHGLKPVTGIPDGQCLELRSADSQVRYSAENQRLTFIIPQAWMRYQGRTGCPLHAGATASPPACSITA